MSRIAKFIELVENQMDEKTTTTEEAVVVMAVFGCKPGGTQVQKIIICRCGLRVESNMLIIKHCYIVIYLFIFGLISDRSASNDIINEIMIKFRYE
jgi:hypothetical protein